MAADSDPAGLDPTRHASQSSWRIARMLFEGLTALDASGGVRPAAAKRWEHGGGAVRWTFHLRPGLRWSDGTPLTASDFVYAWRRALDPDTGAETAGSLYGIRGARAVNGGDLPPAALGVEALSDSTLAVELEGPDPELPFRTALPPFYPLPAHTVRSSGPAWPGGRSPVCNGPFLLESWHTGERLTLRPNPAYWNRPAVSLERVVVYPLESEESAWNLYRAGDVDWTTANRIGTDLARSLIAGGYAEVRTTPVLQVYYLELNTRRPPLDDRRVRRALEMTAPRDEIARRIFGAGQTPTRRFVNTDLPGWDPPPAPEGGPEQARLLLEAAAHPGGEAAGPMTFLYNDRAVHAAVAQYLQGVWHRELGVEIELVQMDFNSMDDRARRGDFHILRSGWLADLPFPEEYLKVFRAGDPNNATGWSDPEYDRLLDTAAREADPARKRELLREAEAILLEAAVIIPILQNSSVQLIKPYVEGLRPNLLDVVDWTGVRVRTDWRPPR
ncbi:MAG: peptide ABC transporter substrate-binding protein [bacterium]